MVVAVLVRLCATNVVCVQRYFCNMLFDVHMWRSINVDVTSNFPFEPGLRFDLPLQKQKVSHPGFTQILAQLL